MRICVTGGAGFLGRVLINYLRTVVCHEKPHVVVYDNLLYSDAFLTNVDFIRGDVCNYEKLSRILEKTDAVVWLAAIVGDAACSIDPSKSIAVNRDAVAWLSQNYAGRIIFPSTCSVYGVNDEIATEESPPNPVSLYAETKIAAEEALADNAMILRFGTLHGTSQRMRFDLGVNAMALSAIKEKKITVYGGSQYRPWLSVHDASGLISHILLNEGFYRAGVFNVASQNEPVKRVAEIVQTVYPRTPIVTMSSESEDKRNYRVSCGRLTGLLNHSFTWQKLIGDSALEVGNLVLSGRLRDPYSPIYNNATALRSL